MLCLGNPLGNVTYNLGTVSNNQYLQIWKHLTIQTIENKASQHLIANQYREVINHFLKNHETPKETIKEKKPKTINVTIKNYKKIIQDWKKEKPAKEEKPEKCWCEKTGLSIPHWTDDHPKKKVTPKTKHKRPQLRKKSKRSKEPLK